MNFSTISIMLMARVYSGTGHLNSATNDINGDNMGNHGIELEDIMKQNFTSIIVQEKDRCRRHKQRVCRTTLSMNFSREWICETFIRKSRCIDDL
jgi:hypothetical protein